MKHENIIETLLLWNFWEKNISTGIERKSYQDTLQKYLTTDEIVVVTGIRRSGKSTILLQMVHTLIQKGVSPKNTLYVNFEDPKFFNEVHVDFLDALWDAYTEYLNPKGKVYVVFDEIQRIQGWEQWVRARYDRKENIKIFVTGSNAELLSSEFSHVLTGRHLQVHVFPLDFSEFLQFKGMHVDNESPLFFVKHKSRIKKYMIEYLKNGGFPKVVLTDDAMIQNELLSQCFSDILTKDIVERHNITDVGKLKNMAFFYVSNIAHTFSFNNINKIKDFALSLDSIHRFSQYLEEAFLLYSIKRFSYSLKNQMQAYRKNYIIDTGFYNAVAFKFSENIGKVLENAVCMQLQRQADDIFYFSEKREVDFVCKKGTRVTELIQVCYDISDKETFRREKDALMEAMQYFGLKKSKLITGISERNSIREKGYSIEIIPFYEWVLGR